LEIETEDRAAMKDIASGEAIKNARLDAFKIFLGNCIECGTDT